MAVQIPQGYRVTSVEPIDSRLVLTKEQMLQYSAHDELMPPVYFCLGAERDDTDNFNIYIYNRYDEPDVDTGKFHVFTEDYRLLANTPKAGTAIDAIKLEKDPPFDGWTPVVSVLYDSETLEINNKNELAVAVE